MEIEAFRVENFRSIRDTGWQCLSLDSITVLVGQNESGKTSILDGLDMGYCITPKIDPDDFRLEGELPRISLSGKFSNEYVDDLALTQPEEYREALRVELRKHKKVTVISRIVEREGKFERIVSFSDDLMALIVPLISPPQVVKSDSAESDGAESTAEDTQEPRENIDYKEKFLEELWRCIPEFVLFRETACSLPNRIDLVKGKLAKDSGERGASNFIEASELDLNAAISSDHRRRDAALSKASAKVTRDLQAFWSQVLGRSDRISLSCQLKHHASSEPSKAGQPYLAFWVKEGDQPLYPSQRSRGTRWFMSFFLELFAGNKKHPGRVVLLDEPANFLHPAAQKDVIKLLEKLAKETTIVYSTHSPYMLDQTKLHRVLAVERQSVGEDDLETATIVRRGLELASASQLTLAPILHLIGVDLSHQQTIKKTRNVLLEEVSAQYYLRAFLKLLDVDAEVHLVACSGVDTVKTIVDLFVAWGISFTVLVDDDPHGKRVVRDIKAKYFLSDNDAKSILQTFTDCEGIEDAFSKEDFRQHVLGGEQYETRNSAHVKKLASKPMLALKFSEKVMRDEVSLQDLSTETVDRIKDIVARLLASLDNHQA